MPVLFSPISFDIEPLADLEPSGDAYCEDLSIALPKLGVEAHQSPFFKLVDERPDPLTLEESHDKLDFAKLEEHPPDHVGKEWLLDKQQLVEAEKPLLVEGLNEPQSKYKVNRIGSSPRDAFPHITVSSTPREPQLLAMCLLMVGRPSAWFRWNDRKQGFEAVQQIVVPGLSHSSTQEVLSSVLNTGELSRQLKHVQSSSITKSAFKSCIDECLVVLEEWLSSASIRSTTDVQQACDRTLEIVDSLWQIHAEIIELKSDGAVVSALHAVTKRYSESSNKLTGFVSAIAAEVYRPWLEELLQWISSERADRNQTDMLPLEVFPADVVEVIRRAKSNTEFLRRLVPAYELPPLILPSLASTGTASQIKATTLPDETLRGSNHAWSAFTRQSLNVDLQFLLKTEPGPADPPYIVALHCLLSDKHTGSQTAVSEPITVVSSTLTQYGEATSRAVLEHLHKTLDLTTHLRSHYQYFLCGNADFVDHIRSAIFGNMDGLDSLRLNDLDVPWPPRTSRLSLALLSIVGNTTASFVIKQLPEDEMQRVCDPLSIHALDFLQLKVETPAALSFLAASDYDQIFAALLLDMRMLHLVTKLRRSNSAPLAVNQMFHVVATISSHFMQLVVEDTWTEFLHAVSMLQSTEELERAHSLCLSRIRSGLFLRSKQLHIRRAIEDFYAVVLQTKGHIQAGDTDKIFGAAKQIEQSLRTYVRMIEANAEEADVRMMILLGRLAPGSEHVPDD